MPRNSQGILKKTKVIYDEKMFWNPDLRCIRSQKKKKYIRRSMMCGKVAILEWDRGYD